MRTAPEGRAVGYAACLALAVVCGACAQVELRGNDPRLVARSWLRTQELASMGGAAH
jgi:hypothetical protein